VLAPGAAGLVSARPGGDVRGIAALTGREREVLGLLADGRSNREIARLLGVSEKTIKTHVSAVLAKLGVADRTQAALLAVRHLGS
jgi:DNA-binding NarL/FixJ family response regulator